MSFKVEILLPKSDMFPSLELNFLNGLEQALNHPNNGNNIPTLIIESIGNTSNHFHIKITKYLQSKIISTTRDSLIYNNFNESLIVQFKPLKFEYHKTTYLNTVIKTLDTLLNKSLYQKLEKSPLTGWQNPYYICT
ncbi:hypothetical protein [uncultured Lutibacter sp.]|uniref:hypothetical protein n=1 Tax=uncultured Lutibacter sp. TaxID=437739 RepID=UPI00260D8452|nr:hypothetical protein [uncultured Lutibacter sp.]